MVFGQRIGSCRWIAEFPSMRCAAKVEVER
jgi:hypothetical protein